MARRRCVEVQVVGFHAVNAVVVAGIGVNRKKQVGLFGYWRWRCAVRAKHRSRRRACRSRRRRARGPESVCPGGATSSERSFSIRPLGPMVPVSWPPWPASITMRLVLSPSARVRESLADVSGSGTEPGPTRRWRLYRCVFFYRMRLLSRRRFLLRLRRLLRKWMQRGWRLRRSWPSRGRLGVAVVAEGIASSVRSCSRKVERWNRYRPRSTAAAAGEVVALAGGIGRLCVRQFCFCIGAVNVHDQAVRIGQLKHRIIFYLRDFQDDAHHVRTVLRHANGFQIAAAGHVDGLCSNSRLSLAPSMSK